MVAINCATLASEAGSVVVNTKDIGKLATTSVTCCKQRGASLAGVLTTAAAPAAVKATTATVSAEATIAPAAL